jgi:hypothetical protein
MVLTILLAALCGIMAVGSVKGWFDSDEAESALTVGGKTGIVMIERSGIAYEVSEGTVVRESDVLYTKKMSTLQIMDGENARISLDGNAEIAIRKADAAFAVDVLHGDALIDARGLSGVSVATGDTQITANDAVISVSTQAGSGMVYVFSGNATLTRGEETVTVEKGQVVTIVAGGMEQAAFNANSLSEAQMVKLIACGMDDTFCLTKADLEQIRADREAEKLKAQQELIAQQEAAKQEAIRQEQAKIENDLALDPSTGTSSASSGGDVSISGNTGSSGVNGNSSTPAGTCTIEIRCDTILNNMENLTAGKEGFVPSNGTILGTTQVTFYEGETVFDVLQRVCSNAGIQLEYSWTPMYDSYYIEGINHLYEFDCGDTSGWKYKVNGWFPNYGCSSYDLQDGDSIVWCYTCVGLGADVGGGM